MSEKKKLTTAEAALEILLLQEKIKELKDAIARAGGMNSSYAKLHISSNGSNWSYLETLKSFTILDVEAVSGMIKTYLEERLQVLEEELNSYVISKKL